MNVDFYKFRGTVGCTMKHTVRVRIADNEIESLRRFFSPLHKEAVERKLPVSKKLSAQTLVSLAVERVMTEEMQNIYSGMLKKHVEHKGNRD